MARDGEFGPVGVPPAMVEMYRKRGFHYADHAVSTVPLVAGASSGLREVFTGRYDQMVTFSVTTQGRVAQVDGVFLGRGNPLPTLRLTPPLLNGPLLGNRVDLESHAFNSRYDIYSPDARFATALFDPSVMAWLQEQRDFPTVHLVGRWMFVEVDDGAKDRFITKELVNTHSFARSMSSWRLVASLVDRFPLWARRQWLISTTDSDVNPVEVLEPLIRGTFTPPDVTGERPPMRWF